MSTPTVRRYYLAQRRFALACLDTFEAGLWRAKQQALAWPDLPADFPARAALICALYTTVRDLDGACTDELEANGLNARDALRVIAAMESWRMIAVKLLTYQRQDGRFAEVYNAPLAPSSTQTASGVGDTYEMGELSCLDLTLNVSAISGAGATLDVGIDQSHDGVNWYALERWAQKTAVSTEQRTIGGASRFVRLTWTIAGTTPSVTFDVNGEAK